MRPPNGRLQFLLPKVCILSCCIQISHSALGLETRNLYDFVVQVILCQINIFCLQLFKNMTSDFVRFMKINSNRSEIQTLQNLCFEFQIVNLRKSDKIFLFLFWVN